MGRRICTRVLRHKPKLNKKQRKSRHETGDAVSAGGTKKYPKRACFFCEDEGHIATTCELKREFLKTKKRSTGSTHVVGTSIETQKIEDKDFQYASFWAAFRGIRDEREWLLDSGTSDHICGAGFTMQNEYAYNLSVTTADGRTIQSPTCGHIMMKINVNGKKSRFCCKTCT